jgi:hypothetical protein
MEEIVDDRERIPRGETLRRAGQLSADFSVYLC